MPTRLDDGGMKYLVESGAVFCPLRQREVDVESCYHCRWFRDLWESAGQHLIVSCEFVERTRPRTHLKSSIIAGR